jgi:hypothetical protein
MVQPKYNPQEALERVKLMMNYDLSKTSTENKKVIEEQAQPNSDPFACVKNYYTPKNIKFKEGRGGNGKYLEVFLSKEITWIFNIEYDKFTGDRLYWYVKGTENFKNSDSFGTWTCEGNSNFIINKSNGTVYKSSDVNTSQTVQPVAQPKADNKQGTPDPSKPQKLKPKDSPLGNTLKDTSIPKRSCVVYVDQLFEAWERSRGQKFDTNQINELRGYVQRCMDDHFPSGSKQGNWGITGLGGGKTDQKLLQLSACKSPAPSQSAPDSIFRLARKC